MFMVCWHYCIPFLNFLLYAIGPILIIFGAYMLKRGRTRYRRPLRRQALILWLLAVVKMVFIDYRSLMKSGLCGLAVCDKPMRMGIDISALVLMGVAGFFWLKLYRKLLPDDGYRPVRGDIKILRLWTQLSAITVSLFVIWVLGPFSAGLFTGTIPPLFVVLSWHYFAILALVSLMLSFWKLEECQWYYSSTKSGLPHKKDVWVPKDTLWTLTFVYGLTAIMAFVSSSMIKDAAL